jgi:hypothetical protein
VSEHYKGESNEEGEIYLDKTPLNKIFIYDANTFEKIQPISIDLEKGKIVIEQAFLDVEIDFDYYYQNGATSCVLGQKLI